jgi:hypothetical protein
MAASATDLPLFKPRTAKQTEGDLAALERAETGQSLGNYPTIFGTFMERGIPEDEINPRENVLTYRAWLAKGRQVQKGEKGCRIVVYVPDDNDDKKRKPRYASVFHISQTRDAREPQPEPEPEPKPDPEPESSSEHALSLQFMGGGAKLTPRPAEPEPSAAEGDCAHSKRIYNEPGAPCKACGLSVHDS